MWKHVSQSLQPWETWASARAPELMRLLVDDKLNGNVRKSLATALGNLGERSLVAPELMCLLFYEKLDVETCQSIATALGNRA